MLDLLQITNDPAFAERCDAIGGMRLFVDLERHGKAERQAGRNTFITTHRMGDVERVKRVLRHASLMVRVNPLHQGSQTEVADVISAGADMIMLPMFSGRADLHEFCSLVAGRLPVVALLETAQALHSLNEWISTPGVAEVFVGLNDLHLSLQCDFMFEPLAMGYIDHVAESARQHGLKFGFGGIARLAEGLLPGRDVLAEHERLGSHAVILSRTFHLDSSPSIFEEDVAALRESEIALSARSDSERMRDRDRIWRTVERIAEGARSRT